MNSRRALLRLVPLTLCVAAALALLTFSLNPESPTPPAPTLETPGTAALRAAIDPETGELVTGPAANRVAGTSADKAVDADLARMLSRSDEGLQPVHHPDGRVSVNLEGRFMNASVARIGSDGRVETLCTKDMAEAERFLAPTAQTDANGLEVQ